MTDTRLLVGSLSNDLLRVANMVQRGSTKASVRFLEEAKRWTDFYPGQVKDYVYRIAEDVKYTRSSDLNLEKAEKFLMYSVLLQNYALHMS